jgi:UDP-N-acetylglucosamine--N-acetylmuramyl-(pentapeptide) pyrophosphoryl-undecaprenol N-acetylglucosamine transferase
MSTSTSKRKASNSKRRNKQIKIIIAGGGTGGHIFPAIAIANAIKAINPDVKIMFIGANGKMEMDKVPQAGYHISGLTIAGFDRTSLLNNLSLPLKLIKSFLEVRRVFKKFRPTIAIGVGGYSTYPVLRYAQFNGIPTFIHESNSFAGKSNILLGKRATKIFVASDGMGKFFPKDKIFVTGNPVRKSIVDSNITKKEALDFFGLKEEKQTILIVGGSLGARSINNVLFDSLEKLGEAGLQLIWQTGSNNANKYLKSVKGKDFIWVRDFILRMDLAYAAADIVISRAGAMALTELCVVGKPAIFVPYPFAAEDHQTANAIALVEKEAALLVKDNEVNDKLVNTLIALSKDEALQAKLKANISALAVRNADEVIAKEILTPIS